MSDIYILDLLAELHLGTGLIWGVCWVIQCVCNHHTYADSKGPRNSPFYKNFLPFLSNPSHSDLIAPLVPKPHFHHLWRPYHLTLTAAGYWKYELFTSIFLFMFCFSAIHRSSSKYLNSYSNKPSWFQQVQVINVSIKCLLDNSPNCYGLRERNIYVTFRMSHSVYLKLCFGMVE